MFKERGELVLLKFAERLAEVGQVEGLPKLEGKRMLMVIAPKTAKKKAASSSSAAE
jgi:translation initiation factor IF-3